VPAKTFLYNQESKMANVLLANQKQSLHVVIRVIIRQLMGTTNWHIHDQTLCCIVCVSTVWHKDPRTCFTKNESCGGGINTSPNQKLMPEGKQNTSWEFGNRLLFASTVEIYIVKHSYVAYIPENGIRDHIGSTKINRNERMTDAKHECSDQ